MNPTPGQVASIKSFVSGLAGAWSNTDAQIRAAMALATQANPSPQATVPKPFTVDDLVGAVSTANQPNVAALATTIDAFLDAVDAQNITKLTRFAKLLKTQGKLTAADMTALGLVVNATQPDPSWTALVGWDVAVLGRAADDYDIEAARHS